MSETPTLECMVDLETLGKNSKACLLSIGACHFDPKGKGIHGDPFEVFIDPESCVEIGMVIDASTVMWWMDSERDDARKVMMEPTNRVHIRTALSRFTAWFGGNKPLYGNGATFDNVILRNAYELAGMVPPWAFWNDRCYRTLKSRAPDVKLERQGILHSAKWDAVSQAVHLQAINAHLSGE